MNSELYSTFKEVMAAELTVVTGLCALPPFSVSSHSIITEHAGGG